MRQTGNDNLIWLWGPSLVNQSIKYDKYALELWISTELAIENQFYKTKMKIFKESVFHRLVNLFTVRFLYLNVRPWDCAQNRASDGILRGLFLLSDTCEMFRHFLLPNQNNATSSPGFLGCRPFSGVYPVLLTSFSGHGKRVSNFVIASW